MTLSNSVCDVQLLQRFLAGDLSDPEVSRMEEHLDDCEGCCQRLEDSAAEPVQWRNAREHLQAIDVVGLGPNSEETTDFEADSGEWSLDFLAPTDDPQMLGRLGGYEIVGVVGRGGFGIVLKGFDRALNRFVAIKVLAPHLSSSGAARRRFAREAQAAAAVVHDNVIAIHCVDEAGGLPYLVMPYVRGVSLQKRIREHGPLQLSEILRIGMQTAAGLAAAHAQGLVHRDVKPANVLLPTGVERVKLTDFGLARAVDDASVTRTGVIAGTPQYMSPEQAVGESVDAASDLFSLGSLLYAAATGRAPFRGDNSYAILRRITDGSPRSMREVNTAIPLWLEHFVRQLHDKDPHRRPAASEVAVLLEQCLAHVQQPDAHPLPKLLRDAGKAERAQRRRSRLKKSACAAAAALLLLSVVGGIVVLLGQFAGPQTSRSADSPGSSTQPGESARGNAETTAHAATLPQGRPTDPVASSGWDADGGAANGWDADGWDDLDVELSDVARRIELLEASAVETQEASNNSVGNDTFVQPSGAANSPAPSQEP